MPSSRRLHQRGIGKRADTHRDIEVLLGQIDHPIDQQQAERDARKSLEELGRDRQRVQPAEHDRRGDCEFALGLPLLSGDAQ